MKQILLALLCLILISSCDKKGGNNIVVIPPPDTAHVSTFDTLRVDSLNGYTLNFTKNHYIIFKYASRSTNIQYGIDPSTAVLNDTIIYISPLVNCIGFYVSAPNCYFRNITPPANWGIKTTSTSLTATYVFNGYISPTYNFTWFYSQQ